MFGGRSRFVSVWATGPCLVSWEQRFWDRLVELAAWLGGTWRRRAFDTDWTFLSWLIFSTFYYIVAICPCQSEPDCAMRDLKRSCWFLKVGWLIWLSLYFMSFTIFCIGFDRAFLIFSLACRPASAGGSWRDPFFDKISLRLVYWNGAMFFWCFFCALSPKLCLSEEYTRRANYSDETSVSFFAFCVFSETWWSDYLHFSGCSQTCSLDFNPACGYEFFWSP